DVTEARVRERGTEVNALVGPPDAALAADQHRLGPGALLRIASENDGAARPVAREHDGGRQRHSGLDLERFARDVARAEQLDQPGFARAGVDRAGPLARHDDPVAGLGERRRRAEQQRDRGGPALHLTKLLSWMIGSSTASTISMTTPPMPTMSIGSRIVAICSARRCTSPASCLAARSSICGSWPVCSPRRENSARRPGKRFLPASAEASGAPSRTWTRASIASARIARLESVSA